MIKMIRSNKNEKEKRFPWEIFVKHIQVGTPELDGIYLCYYKPHPPLAHDNFPMAGMKVASYYKGAWGCGEMVIGFMGPLPTLSLDELVQEGQCLVKQFVVGTLKEAAKNEYRTAYFPQYILAVLDSTIKKKGDFIFEVNTHKGLPIPLSKYNENTNKWEPLKEIEQYLKTIKLLQRRT